VLACGVDVSKELIGHVGHLAEDWKVASPLDLQAVGPGPSQQVILLLDVQNGLLRVFFLRPCQRNPSHLTKSEMMIIMMMMSRVMK